MGPTFPLAATLSEGAVDGKRLVPQQAQGHPQRQQCLRSVRPRVEGGTGKVQRNFSREDEAELDEDDIPYVNYGMHLLIKHYFDQYSVDEFDIEDHEVQQHSTNRKGRAPTAKVKCFQWYHANRKPVFCKNSMDFCPGWYCISDAHNPSSKHEHCDYCIGQDPSLGEEGSKDTSVAASSPPRSQAMSESSAGDCDSVETTPAVHQHTTSMSQRTELESKLDSLDGIKQTMTTDSLLRHVVQLYGGCPNRPTCSSCGTQCLQALMLP